MIIEIYENKQGNLSSVRALEKYNQDQVEFRKYFGTKKNFYTIEKEKAFKECKSFWLGKLQLNKRVDLQMNVRAGKDTFENFVNNAMSIQVF